MTNPAHQSHKVSGVYHIYNCFGFAGFAPAFSHYANRYTSLRRYGRYRRVCTSGFYRGLRRCPERLYEIQKGNNLTFASLLVFPSCVIRCAYRKR